MAVCLGIAAAVLAFGLPGLICWTTAVLIARAMRDRPCDLRVTADVALTGVLLELIWMFLMLPIALAAVFVVVVAVALSGPASLNGLPSSLTVGVACIVLLGVSLIGFRPILVEEWRRLTA